MCLNRVFQVAEIRAGDIPLPSDCPWRCRYSSVRVLNTESTARTNLMTREMRCSNDGWRTTIGTSAMYGYVEEGGELDLFYARESAGYSKVPITLEARDTVRLADGTTPPEVP
jgi:hypothetical protein